MVFMKRVLFFLRKIGIFLRRKKMRPEQITNKLDNLFKGLIDYDIIVFVNGDINKLTFNLKFHNQTNIKLNVYLTPSTSDLDIEFISSSIKDIKLLGDTLIGIHHRFNVIKRDLVPIYISCLNN